MYYAVVNELHSNNCHWDLCAGSGVCHLQYWN